MCIRDRATTERNKAIDGALADAINDPYGQKWNQDNTSTGEINTEHKMCIRDRRQNKGSSRGL